MPEIKYEITEHLGVISETARGWTREVNMISWNGREPKIDVRDWSPDHSKMSKLMKLKSLQSSLKISKIKYLGATRKFVALEILLREFCFLCN